MDVKGPFQPLHWVIDEEGSTIFNAGERVRSLRFGEAFGRVVHSTDAVREALVSGIEGTQSACDAVDERLPLRSTCTCRISTRRLSGLDF